MVSTGVIRIPPTVIISFSHYRLANFGTFLALASYSRGIAHRVSAEHHYVRFATMFQTVLSMILTFYMWCVCGKPSRTFDNQPECASDIRYVIFVINVPALGSGRIVGLMFVIIYFTMQLSYFDSADSRLF